MSRVLGQVKARILLPPAIALPAAALGGWHRLAGLTWPQIVATLLLLSITVVLAQARAESRPRLDVTVVARALPIAAVAAGLPLPLVAGAAALALGACAAVRPGQRRLWMGPAPALLVALAAEAAARAGVGGIGWLSGSVPAVIVACAAGVVAYHLLARLVRLLTGDEPLGWAMAATRAEAMLGAGAMALSSVTALLWLWTPWAAAGMMAALAAAGYLPARRPSRERPRVDPETQLATPWYANEFLEQEIHRTFRFNRPLCVLLIDVDHLADLNATYGRAAGDALLTRVRADRAHPSARLQRRVAPGRRRVHRGAARDQRR